MKKVLITGAAGFIGGQLMRIFGEHPDEYIVSGLDRGYGEIYGNLIDTVDLTNIGDVIAYLEHQRPDLIIHCAGSADVGKSVRHPEMDYENNVTATHNLFFALQKTRLYSARVILLSSAAVYGNPAGNPVSEKTPINPISPYGLHKAMCEEICNYFRENYMPDVRIVRIFSAYGVGLKKQIFWDMYQKYKRAGELELYGTGFETRDYINIEDLLKAIYLISTSEITIPLINVANGEGIMIRKAAETFAECAGIDKGLIHFNGAEQEGNPLNWRADITLLRSLGYTKSVSLRQGLSRYISWLEQINT